MSVFKLPPKGKTPAEKPPRSKKPKPLPFKKAEKLVVLSDPVAAWEAGQIEQQAVDYLYEVGSSLPDRPEDDPEMPRDITAVTLDDVGKLYGQFAGFAVYMAAKVALAEVGAADAECQKNRIWAELHAGYSGTVPDKKAKVSRDPRYMQAETEALIAEAKAKLLKSRLNGYKDFAAVLSREISRRTGDRNE